MSGGLSTREGLRIRLRQDPVHNPGENKLTRISEISAAGDPNFVQMAPALIRSQGLKVAIQYPRARVISFRYSGCQKGQPPARIFDAPQVPSIGNDAADVFEMDRDKWTGFLLKGNEILPPVPPTLPYPATEDAIYVELVVKFNPNNPNKFNLVMPTIATLGNVTFGDHFVLGVSVLNVVGGGSTNFESEVIAIP